MKFTPYPHQEVGVRWLIEKPAASLFWGMGAG